jgi:hypothetical protein
MFSCIWISKKSCRLLIGTPISFLNHSKKNTMKWIWGFKLERVFFFNSKHFKQNIIVFDFEIKFVFHCFAAFETQKGIIDR